MDAKTTPPRPEEPAMATRWQLTVVALCTLLATSSAHADIYRWDTGEVIPGTEGIEPGPGVELDHMELEYANLREMDLTGADFEMSVLSRAELYAIESRQRRFTGASVTRADSRDRPLLRSTGCT